MAHHNYESELENIRMAKKEDNNNGKRKIKQEEIQNLKKNKMLKMLSVLSEKVSIVKR